MVQASAPIKKIVIVGGGTAGWMAANLMAVCWRPLGIEITLIESSDIGIIGVGEGSTPQLKSFFDFLNIQESEWMPECNATYKNGITFADWSTQPGFSSYFHAFESEVDFKTEPAFFYNCEMRRKGVLIEAHPDKFYLSAHLTEQKLSPIARENFPFKVAYGYHFDATLVGKFLHKKAAENGVTHIDAIVEEVNLSSSGNISSVTLKSGEQIEGDMFVDCTGFRSLLLQKTLNIPFVKFEKNLFNDSAVTIQTPKEENFQPHTKSTALKNGWAWKIPLTNRVGNGYVYSSSYCSAEEAEQELKQHLNLEDTELPVRHLKMNVGRVEKHWHRNCLAVGLSQGFIEPLEATALHLVQETIQGFIDAFELGKFTNANEDKFNERINAKYEGIRDYIVTHYILNSRNDTQYWQDNRNNTNISDNLKQLLTCWHNGGDLTEYLKSKGIDKYYTPMSWHSILSGYGTYPSQNQLRPGTAKANRYNLNEVNDFIERCSSNFIGNSELLKSLAD